MLYSKDAYESSKFERDIQIQCSDSNSLAAYIQEKLLGLHFQKVYLVYIIRCIWMGSIGRGFLAGACLYKWTI